MQLNNILGPNNDTLSHRTSAVIEYNNITGHFDFVLRNTYLHGQFWEPWSRLNIYIDLFLPIERGDYNEID